MQLTEQIQLKYSSKLSELCHKTKSLYNLANFHVRQFFFNLEELINYYDLQFILKNHICYTSLSVHGKKLKCNLFKRGNGQRINGDVNGAYNILKKAVPNVFAEERVGLVLVPLSVCFKRNCIQKQTKSAYFA